ncbi:hypothetical protein HDR61_02190 [bacterium]|nr:hypothetical protein [bacterium]
MGIKKAAANVVCGFIPNKKLRHRVRTRLNYDIKQYIDFARRDAGRPNGRARTYSGHGGMKKIIVVLDDVVAYKFPLVAARADSPRREKMFADAFRDISPIYIPKMEILEFNGMDVLKYDFHAGKTLADMDTDTILRHEDKIANQLAAFIFELGRSDPESIRHMKPADVRPGMFYGWYHNDIGGNFVVDPDTGDIVAFIDWESAAFCDMHGDLMRARRFLDKRGAGALIMKTVFEYIRLYQAAE